MSLYVLDTDMLTLVSEGHPTVGLRLAGCGNGLRMLL